jgi:SH3-like domain-containing protein
MGLSGIGIIHSFGDLMMSGRLFLISWLLVVFAFLNPGAAFAQNINKGKLVQRYASLRANDVNVRAGPGVRYPVKWKFVQRHTPVEVIAQYDTWRKIRDWEGGEGWVHRAMIANKRSLLLKGDGQTMRRRPSEGAPAVARLASNMIVLAKKCDLEWCLVSARGHDGWIRRKGLWGLYPKEEIR